MRNATVYGVSPRLRLDVVLNNLVAWAHTTGAIRLQSDGSSWRPLVHVRDVARATLALPRGARGARVRRGVQHRLGRENFRIRDLAEIVHERFPECEVDVRRGRVSRSAELPRRLLEARVGVPGPAASSGRAERGADELARAYAAAGLTLRRLRGPPLHRLDQLKRLLDELPRGRPPLGGAPVRVR